MQKHWLHAAPWESVVTVNKALCHAQKLDPTTNARHFEKAHTIWDGAVARSLSLKEVLDVCRECQEMLPFTFNNGNTFAAVGRTLIEEGTKKLSPVEAQVVQTTICHYIAGLIGRRELLQVLKHFEGLWQAEPPRAKARPVEAPVVSRVDTAPMLTEAHPRA